MGGLWFPMCLPRPLRSERCGDPDLPAKNDHAVRQIHRGVWFAGKLGSFSEERSRGASDTPRRRSPVQPASLAPTGEER